MTDADPLLSVRGLTVDFQGHPAVDGVDLDVCAGEVVGIVGESGSGKSVAMLALLGLVDAPGRVTAQRLAFDGIDMRAVSARQRRRIIGKDVAMIFQDAMTSLDPAYTVGFQIREVLAQHTDLRGAALDRRVLELLDQVEIPDARNRMGAYVHQLSGGMSQRVMIAMAIACDPKLLIADEPTTALDVTVQAQVMRLLKRLQAERGMSLLLISHDLAVVADVAQRVAVMYAGEVVEIQPAPDIFQAPHHPYTAALLEAIPERNRGAARLNALPGMVPGRYERPRGCVFAPRCAYVVEACRAARPALAEVGGVDGVRGADDTREAEQADLAGGSNDSNGSSEPTGVAAKAPEARVRCIKPLNLAPTPTSVPREAE